MNIKKESVAKTKEGFLFGIGFSFAALIVFLLFTYLIVPVMTWLNTEKMTLQDAQKMREIADAIERAEQFNRNQEVERNE